MKIKRSIFLVVLDGGSWQQRATGIGGGVGNIRIQSNSKILLIDGVLKWATGLSSETNATLKVASFTSSFTSDVQMIFNATDLGFQGLFQIWNTENGDETWRVQFDKSYSNAISTVADATFIRLEIENP